MTSSLHSKGPVVFFLPPQPNTSQAASTAPKVTDEKSFVVGTSTGLAASLVLSPLSNPHGTIMGTLPTTNAGAGAGVAGAGAGSAGGAETSTEGPEPAAADGGDGSGTGKGACVICSY